MGEWRRKLITQGGTGLTFYVPKEWADRRKLKAGDEVIIRETDSELIINTHGIKAKHETEISIDTESIRAVNDIILNLYVMGYDCIHINTKRKSTAPIIQSFLKKFISGFEITAQDTKKITIESISETTEEKQDILTKRSLIILKEVLNAIEEEITGNIPHKEHHKDELLKRIAEQIQRVNQYCNMCRRNISRYRQVKTTPELEWALQTQILQVSNSLFATYEFVYKEKKTISPIVREFFLQIKKYYEQIYHTYLMAKSEELYLTYEIYERMRNTYFHIVQKQTGKNALLLAHLGFIASRTYQLSFSMVRMLLAKEIKEKEYQEKIK